MDVAEFFFEVDDPRQDGKCFHQLSDIMLCGYPEYCEGFEEVYDYACDKQDISHEFLDLPCDIPSHDTLSHIFCLRDPAQLESVLTNRGKQMEDLLAQMQLTLHGMQLRGTVEAGHKQADVQIFSV